MKEDKLTAEEQLRLFKRVVGRLMYEASKILGELELEVSGPQAEKLISLLDHHINYTQQLCRGKNYG